MQSEEQQKMRRLLGAIHWLRTMKVSGNWELSAKEMEALLLIAAHPNELSLLALAERLNVPAGATTTRFCDRIGRGKAKSPGLGLVDFVEDPEDRRRKILYLTNKGEQVLRKMLAEVF